METTCEPASGGAATHVMEEALAEPLGTHCVRPPIQISDSEVGKSPPPLPDFIATPEVPGIDNLELAQAQNAQAVIDQQAVSSFVGRVLAQRKGTKKQVKQLVSASTTAETQPAPPLNAPETGGPVRGTVRFFDARVRFYGFITADDGSDVYCHRNFVKKGHRLYPDTPVEFEIKPTPKGLQARKVRVVGS